jgi:hypothetical protein
MKLLTAQEVQADTSARLGLVNGTRDLTSIDALAGLLRRAAGAMCPCPPRTVVDRVLDGLRGLTENDGGLREQIEDTLDRLVAYGDLREVDQAENDDGPGCRILDITSPRFVWRQSGTITLLGIAPDLGFPLPTHLRRRVLCVDHVRRLYPDPDHPEENLRQELVQFGIPQVSQDTWLQMPPFETTRDCLGRYADLLTPITGELPGLTVLNPSRPVRYYRGRWEGVRKQSGRFVARRRQLYGADAWCYVELQAGRPSRMAELPTMRSGVRGCDEAWYLQAAIDAERGAPQIYRLRTTNAKERTVDLFSPPPRWTQRRLDAFGWPVPREKCLLSYRFPVAEVPEEEAFLRERLWLVRVEA